MLQWEPFAGGHIGPGGRSVRQRRAGRDGAHPYRRGERADGGEVRYRECTAAGRCGHRPLRETRVAAGCGHPALRVHHRWCAASGPMYLRHGFRRPNFVPKFGASVIGIGPYEKEGKPPRPPGPAAHSEASATRMGGRGGNRDRDPPQSVQQPRAIPQSPSGRQLPLHKGAFPCGGRGSGRTHRSAPTRSSECTATPGGAGQSPPPTERRGIRRGIGQRTPNAGSRSAGPPPTSSPAS